MNPSLHTTAAATDTGLSLVADAMRADLKTLGYDIKALIVSTQTQIEENGLANYSSMPWIVSAFIDVQGFRKHFQTTGDKAEEAFADLLKQLPPVPVK